MLFEDEFTSDAEISALPVEGLNAPRDSNFLIGHDDIEQDLIKHIEQGNMPHALIFSGAEGIGKSTMAFRLARYLLAYDKNDDNQDGLFGEPEPTKIQSLDVDKGHDIFTKVSSGGHPDLLTIEKSIDSKTQKEKKDINIETARKIAPFLRMTSSEGGWRIVILDNADTMNKNAQNAILKILEEPPKKTLLILICGRINAMIPTIRSRCRVVSFSPLVEEDFYTLLKKEYGSSFSDEEKKLLMLLSNQQFGTVKKIMNHDGLETVQSCLDILNNYPEFDMVKIHHLADTIGRAGQDKVFEITSSFFATLLSEIVFAKAKNQPVNEALQNNFTKTIISNKSLHDLLRIDEKIKNSFSQTIYANLDRRVCLINIFAALRS